MDQNIRKGGEFNMRDLPRLSGEESTEEKIRIIYDWLYEWSKINNGLCDKNSSKATEEQEEF